MSFNPEIRGDELFHMIANMIIATKPKLIIEIGSANGLGSTQAIYTGLSANKTKPGECSVYCFEARKDRYDELVQNVPEWFSCINASTVKTDRWMVEEDIRKFLADHPNIKTNKYPADVVVGWMKEEYDIVKNGDIDKNALYYLTMSIAGIHPSLVIIDGGPFTAMAELDDVMMINPDVLVLDDTEDIKCYDVKKKLMTNAEYMLYKDNPDLRNGYSIFTRVKNV